MKKMHKWTALALTASLIATMLAACGGGDSTGGQQSSGTGSSTNSNANSKSNSNSQGNAPLLNETGMPIVNEPITLKIFAGRAPTNASNWNEVMIWQEYEKMTNIKVEFDLVPFENLAEKRNLVLSSGDYPDAMHTVQLTSSDLVKYGSQGIFIPLNDLIDKYAPNFKQLLEQYPDVKKGITMPDGNIYAFPTLYDPEFTSVLAGPKLWIKQEWLDALNMSMPETLDDFYQYLKKVKETDLNGNGQADEIPFHAFNSNSSVTPILHLLKGAWGLGNRGISHPRVDMDPETNELRFIPADPKYKELLQFVNKLYTEELLPKDLFTTTNSDFLAKGSQGLYGAVITTSPRSLMDQDGYVGAGALAGPYGDRLYSFVRSPIARTGSFVITDKNKYPEATVRWMDYFFGEEGIKMFFMGFKDISYYETEDGNVEYVDEIVKNPDGLTMEQAVIKYVTWPGGSYPGVVKQKYFKGAESFPESVEAAERFKPYLVEEIWPEFSFTTEENAKLLALQTDIFSYVDEMEAKFIAGAVPFSEWDNYVNTLYKMGLAEYMEIYKSGYERYKNS